MRGDAVRGAPSLAGLPLSVAERRVIAMTAAGETIRQIAFSLGMSTTTVVRHRVRILEKLVARNAPNAVAIWLGREALAPALLRPREVAEMLGLHHNRVRVIDRELLPWMRVTTRGDRRYRAVDVAAYVERLTLGEMSDATP